MVLLALCFAPFSCEQVCHAKAASLQPAGWPVGRVGTTTVCNYRLQPHAACYWRAMTDALVVCVAVCLPFFLLRMQRESACC
jgi:hypothetical protein